MVKKKAIYYIGHSLFVLLKGFHAMWGACASSAQILPVVTFSLKLVTCETSTSVPLSCFRFFLFKCEVFSFIKDKKSVCSLWCNLFVRLIISNGFCVN